MTSFKRRTTLKNDDTDDAREKSNYCPIIAAKVKWTITSFSGKLKKKSNKITHSHSYFTHALSLTLTLTYTRTFTLTFLILLCVSGIWKSFGGYGFRLILIFANDTAAPKIVACIKSGQKWPPKNHLTTFTKVQSKSLIHTVYVSFSRVHPLSSEGEGRCTILRLVIIIRLSSFF